MSIRDEIKARDNKGKQTELLEVPEWEISVRVRRMTVIEEEQYWAIIDDANKGVIAPAGKRGSVVLMVATDEAGTALFTAEDANWLGSEANPQAVGRIYRRIMQLSGILEEEQADIEKKPETPTSSSNTGSQIDGESGT